MVLIKNNAEAGAFNGVVRRPLEDEGVGVAAVLDLSVGILCSV